MYKRDAFGNCAAVGIKTEYFFVGNGITMHVKVFVTSEGIINVVT